MKPAHTTKAMLLGKGHYLIDGERHQSIKSIFREAKTRGFTGCQATVHKRLRDGASTWAELCALPPNSAANRRRANDRNQRSRDECAEAMAAVDARRKEIDA